MSSFINSGRVSIRLARPELLILGLLTGIWLSVALLVGWQMRQVSGADPECFTGGPIDDAACSAVLARFGGFQAIAQNLFLASAAAPFLVGAVLGAPLVAREVEEGTSQLAWVLAPSRTYWLIAKALPVAGLAIGMLGLLGLGADLLMSQFQAGLDARFLYYDQRGLALPVRGLCVITVAALIGTVVGRTIPSLILSVVLGAAVVLGINFGMHQIWKGEAVALSVDAFSSEAEDWFGALDYGTAFIAPDGRVIVDYENGIPDNSAAAHLLVHPDRFWPMVGGEFLVLTMVAGAATALTALVTVRRRAL